MEYLTLNNGVQMPLVGFGTFMLGGENCRNAAAAAIQSGYRMVEEAYGNEKDIDERIEKNGIDRCGDGAALRAGQKRAAHRENGNTGIGGVFADVVRGGRMKNVLLLGATGTAGSALEVACRHGMSPKQRMRSPTKLTVMITLTTSLHRYLTARRQMWWKPVA